MQRAAGVGELDVDLEVADVLAGNWDKKTNLGPFIAGASAIVDRIKACAATRSLALSDAELKEIERWLSAHFYCRVDKTYQSKNTGAASAQFTGQTGMSLDSTEYGQTAMNLDWSGCLSALSKRAFAHSTAVGRSPSDQLTSDERG